MLGHYVITGLMRKMPHHFLYRTAEIVDMVQHHGTRVLRSFYTVGRMFESTVLFI